MVKLTKVVCFVAVLVMAFAPMALAQGTYTQIDYPGAVSTGCYAINNSGDVVGEYSDGSGLHGFLLSGGVFTTIDPPGAQRTQAYGINDVGQIVGVADNNGFLYDVATQTFATLRFSHDGSYTLPSSINNTGVIVGSVWPGTGQHGLNDADTLGGSYQQPSGKH